jgi:signal transduction histidine kinase
VWRDGDLTLDDDELAALAADGSRAIVPVTAGSEPIAVLVVARSLTDDPALVEAGTALARLVVRTELQAGRIRDQLDEVRASRLRIVEAADVERRRIERDLHDGLQQRMVALAVQLRAAEGGPDQDAALRDGSAEVLAMLEEVRELARGIHAAVLTEAGLGAAVRAIADRSPVPAEVDVSVSGLEPAAVVATAYYVVSEALANVAKHAPAASAAWVTIGSADGRLRVTVEDDGPGGADPRGGGLSGLADRVAALDGSFRVENRPRGGTIVVADLPLP